MNYQLPPLTQLNQRLLEAPLTYDNYQDKFHMLLYYEEHEHQKELKERSADCSATCTCVYVPYVELYNYVRSYAAIARGYVHVHIFFNL